MNDERIAQIRAGVERARRRMGAEMPWLLVGWLEETLAELERWRPRQERFREEDTG